MDESLTQALAAVAKANINIIDVPTVWDPLHQSLLPEIIRFEFQWRPNTTTTKWTKSVVPYDNNISLEDNISNLRLTVSMLREQLES